MKTAETRNVVITRGEWDELRAKRGEYVKQLEAAIIAAECFLHPGSTRTDAAAREDAARVLRGVVMR